jgi:hypothetical protein
LLTNLSDNEGNRETFILDPEITLSAAKKYLFGMIDIEGSKNKPLPLYYRLKEGFYSTYVHSSNSQESQ